MPWQRALFLIISLAVIYWVLYGEPGYKRSARKFKAFVEANQPRLAEIEKWVATCKVEEQGRFISLSPADWPEALRGLKYGNWDPAYFKIRTKPRAAFIVYGGALGHWGLVMDL